MFFNANGLLMRNVVLGNFQLVDPEVRRRRKRSLSPQYPHDPLLVYGWLEQLGMRISGKPACGCFTTCRADSCKHKNLKSYWRLNSTIAGRSRT